MSAITKMNTAKKNAQLRLLQRDNADLTEQLRQMVAENKQLKEAADLTAIETAEAVRKAVRKAEEKAEKAHDKTKDEVKNLKAALQARGQTAVRHEQVLAEQKEATAQSTSTLEESNRTLEESNRKLESKVARMEEAKKVATAKAAEDTVRYKDALGARVSQHEHTTHQKVELEGEVARLKTKLQEVKDTVRARGTKVADLEYEVRQLLLVPRGRGVWKEPKAGEGGVVVVDGRASDRSSLTMGRRSLARRISSGGG